MAPVTQVCNTTEVGAQTLVCVQTGTRHLKPRESSWGPHCSGEWGLCRADTWASGPWRLKNSDKITLRSERKNLKQQHENKSETCSQRPGCWGIKRKTVSVWRPRAGRPGGPLTPAGDVEEAGVPRRCDAKGKKDAKGKN